MAYAELCARSCFSLLQGASHPEELVEAARALGLTHLALTDRDGVYGLPQAHKVAGDLPLLCGATVTITDAPAVVLLAESHAGWSSLCRLLTRGHGRAAKGRVLLTREDLAEAAPGLTCLLTDGWTAEAAEPLRQAFGDHLEVAWSLRLGPDDPARTERAQTLSRALERPVVATNDVIFHERERRRLADVLTAIRRRTTLAALGRAQQPNAERFVLPGEVFESRYAAIPGAVRRTLEIAERCAFRLSELSYSYPRETVPEGWTAMAWLRELVRRALPGRYPEGASTVVHQQLEHELALIAELDFPSYFLTVHDIVAWARDHRILCQGRGSAANSAVCYVLGITAIDPARASLLFERFISAERGEPPDIDVDFEHERREEVIQYIYERYGRDRAAMVNEVITYRPRSAVRDVGKAFGLSLDQVDRLAKLFGRWSGHIPGTLGEAVREAGLDPDAPAVRWSLHCAQEMAGFPRHVGIHSGGFVIAANKVIDLVPVEPASMPNRTVVQWDKYGVEGLGFVKVDVLALGMLTAIRKAFDLIEGAYGRRWELHTIPAEDPAVYEMFQAADTIGVFQIESRAQQSMLPRLRPECFYDLVIEVAIVRPGPIQGGMVHPYLRRRNGEEEITYAHPALQPILERTAGVPLFQEQVMQIAVAVGGFTPGQADQLRRAMGAWRKTGNLAGLGEQLLSGMLANGLEPAFAERILEQVKGFGEYGFPESHAASFALLVYVSGWLKRHHPEAFCAALINSQPMGFYPPRSLVGDAQRHGVQVRPVDVVHSDWDCTLEPQGAGEQAALRLGLRLVRGLDEAAGRAVVAARAVAPFRHLPDLARRTHLDAGSLQRLAEADALSAFSDDRRHAAWLLQGLWTDLPLFAGLRRDEPRADLPEQTDLEALDADYRAVGLSIDEHPAHLARQVLAQQGTVLKPLSALATTPPNAEVHIMGLVSSRQMPGTAKGVVFIALEDESGMANLVVWRDVWKTYKREISHAVLLGVTGRLQRQDGAWSVLVQHAYPIDVGGPRHIPSRDFR